MKLTVTEQRIEEGVYVSGLNHAVLINTIRVPDADIVSINLTTLVASLTKKERSKLAALIRVFS